MSTHKHIDAICAVIVLAALVITVLFMKGRSFGLTGLSDEEEGDGVFTANDLDDGWDAAKATEITLSDGGTAVEGNGAYVENGDVHIIYGGKYVLSGELSDGQILIETESDDKVWLMLNGVSIHCSDNAAMLVEQAKKVFLTLGENTENSVSTGASYCEDAVSGKVDGAIYSRDDLTVNGAGTLTVTTEYQHGIVCNDDLILTGGDIRINAKKDGIHANDSVRVKNAAITVSAGDDGITVSNDDGTAYFYIESGTVSIPACYEGIEASEVTVAGGTLQITPTDDGINAGGNSENAVIRITGGETTVTNPNGRDADGLDSNKDIIISGGKLIVSVNGDGGNCALDYGSENGGVCRIDGGTVLACGGSSMVEGMDPASAQGFLMYGASAQAGATVDLRDAAGNTLLSETVPCGFTSIVISTPDMKIGDSYTVKTGDTEKTMTVDNTSETGGFGKQMPGQNDFGGRGGVPAENGASAQLALPTAYFSEQSGDAAANGNTAPSNGRNGNQPDFGQGGVFGGGTPPELPQNGTDSGFQNGNDGTQTPDLPQNGTNGNRFQNGNGGVPFDRGAQMPADQNGDAASAGSVEETVDAVSPTDLILLGVSAAVLLLGVGFAFFFRRPGSF